MFREELKRYAQAGGPRITPLQIPPLVPMHMLKPTAPNKMYNARITYRNFGGQLTKSTLAPTDEDAMKANQKAIYKLVGDAPIQSSLLSGQHEGRPLEMLAMYAVVPKERVVRFLQEYRWSVKANPMALAIDFLQKTGAQDPKINDWVCLAPQIGSPRDIISINKAQFGVVYRSRHAEEPARFHTYNDPKHRLFAECITRSKPFDTMNEALSSVCAPHRAVALYYPITDVDGPSKPKPPYTTGFTLLFPENDLQAPITFSVWQPERPDDPTVAGTESAKCIEETGCKVSSFGMILTTLV